MEEDDYINSFKKAAQIEEIKFMAEEGLDDYLKILDKWNSSDWVV